MPQKLNKAGKMQDYIPKGNGDASGEYGTSNGTNKNFTTSDKKKETKANVITENKSVAVGDKKEYATNIESKEKYELDKELIEKANHTSMFYEAGNGIKEQYDRFIKEVDELDLTDEEKAKAKDKLTQLGNEALKTQSKNISWTITGRSNLNVDRYKKNSDRAVNKRAEFENYMENLKASVKKTKKQQEKQEAKANIIDGNLTGNNNNGYDGKIQLQGVGKVDAKKVGNLKVGDILMWNGGATSVVDKLEVSKNGNMITVYTTSSDSGYKGERRFTKDRLVGIAEKEAKDSREAYLLGLSKGKAY